MRIISIAGPMAVGKTSAVRRLSAQLSNTHAVYEDATGPNQLFDMICSGPPDKFSMALKQMLFINDLIEKIKETTASSPIDQIILDRGVEEFFFFWRQTSKYVGRGNDMFLAGAYDDIYRATEKYHSDLIIYLDAPTELLKQRKLDDATRERRSFSTYLSCYVEAEREFHRELGSYVIETAELSLEQVVAATRKAIQPT